MLRGLTVASENPVFLHGDFNTVNKKGAAVLCDAINLLSSAWDDSKTPGNLPAALSTMYNVAIVSGNVPRPDDGSRYSGGFGNLVRFHENWTKETASIRGSFACLFSSAIARSPMRATRDVFVAPLRDWAYDTSFNEPGRLPPFTPQVVTFENALWDDGIPLPFE